NGPRTSRISSASCNSPAMTDAERTCGHGSERPYPGRSYATTRANSASRDAKLPHARCDPPPGSRTTTGADASPLTKNATRWPCTVAYSVSTDRCAVAGVERHPSATRHGTSLEISPRSPLSDPAEMRIAEVGGVLEAVAE